MKDPKVPITPNATMLLKCDNAVEMLSPMAQCLKILLAPDKIESGFRVHVTLDVKLTPEHFRSAEEHSSLCRRMDLANGSEDGVPVGSAETGRRS